MISLEFFDRGDGSSLGPDESALCFCARLSAAVALTLIAEPAIAQDLGNGLLNPRIGGFISPQDLPLRKTSQAAIDSPPAPPAPPSPPDPNDPKPRKREAPAESRIGKVPTYGLPAASGAKEAGYNSLNRKRKLRNIIRRRPSRRSPPVPARSRQRSRRKISPASSASRCRRRKSANKQPLPPGDGRQRAGPAGAPAHEASTTIRSARSAIMPAAS